MSIEKPPPPRPAPEGCLTAFVRVPVRIVVIVLVVPVRLAWDALATAARVLDRTVLRPVGRALAVAGEWLARALFVWPWVGLWRYVLVPLGRYGIAAPARLLHHWVLTPLATAFVLLVEHLLLVPLAALFRYVLVPLFRYGVVAPARWLDRYVLVPSGRGLRRFFRELGRVLAVAGEWLVKGLFVWPWAGLWRYVLVPLGRYGLVRPVGWLWRHVLAPLGRELHDALVIGWRVAGFVSRAVGRALKWLAVHLIGRPVGWFHRHVTRPAGHWVRDTVWAPARRASVEAGRAAREALAAARATARQAREDAWRALVGGTRVAGPGEPEVARARTLGSTTNVTGAAPAPEISPQTRG
ncbi:hypothetical protein [Streptomyces sp. NPDC003327]